MVKYVEDVDTQIVMKLQQVKWIRTLASIWAPLFTLTSKDTRPFSVQVVKL